VTSRSVTAAAQSPVAVSIFPGADLLGRGFEQAGYCVLRGPDLLWGQDVHSFHLVRHIFDGIFGGSPCQGFSRVRRGRREGDELHRYGERMVFEFGRLVTEAQPEWWLLENVPTVSALTVSGYQVQRFTISAAECGMTQYRLRCFQFGYRPGTPALVIPRGTAKAGWSQKAALASEGRRMDRRSWADFCALQGLPRDFDLPGLPRATKYALVGNGVPVPMARTIAEAIFYRFRNGHLRVCICDCGRPVEGNRTLATAGCRKRMQRKRDTAVTGPGPVTPMMSLSHS
jgi:DNA (cytosine-5)-methyltransferase 1